MGKESWVLALGLLFSTPVVAQQPPSITLSCSGTGKLMTASDDAKPDLITNVGMIVDFRARTVTFDNYVVPIEKVDNTIVVFHGAVSLTYGNTKLKPVDVYGSVDRVTGSSSISFTHERVGDNATWELMCKPASRMF